MPKELFAILPHWVFGVVSSAWVLMMVMFGIKLWYQYRYDKWIREHPDWVEKQRKINQDNVETFERLMKGKSEDEIKRGN